jgi:hypothetical protein
MNEELDKHAFTTKRGLEYNMDDKRAYFNFRTIRAEDRKEILTEMQRRGVKSITIHYDTTRESMSMADKGWLWSLQDLFHVDSAREKAQNFKYEAMRLGITCEGGPPLRREQWEELDREKDRKAQQTKMLNAAEEKASPFAPLKESMGELEQRKKAVETAILAPPPATRPEFDEHLKKLMAGMGPLDELSVQIDESLTKLKEFRDNPAHKKGNREELGILIDAQNNAIAALDAALKQQRQGYEAIEQLIQRLPAAEQAAKRNEVHLPSSKTYADAQQTEVNKEKEAMQANKTARDAMPEEAPARGMRI